VRVALDDTAAYQVEKLRSQVLADLDRAKMEFFQNVSHELRTPLTLLLAPLQNLLATSGRPPEERQDLEAALRAAQRLNTVVDALLDFTGAEARTLRPDRQPTDLAELTGQTASMFRATAEHAGLTFQVQLPRTPLTAPVDRTMWATIVSNLLANAVKYTRHGRIEVTLTVTDTDVRLAVTDTGRGIDPAEQALVFDRDSWRNRWTTWKDKRPWTTAGRQRSTLSARSIGESGNVSITQKLCGDASGGRQAEPPAPPHQRVLLRWRVSWPRLAIGRCVAAVDTWKGPGDRRSPGRLQMGRSVVHVAGT